MLLAHQLPQCSGKNKKNPYQVPDRLLKLKTHTEVKAQAADIDE